MSAGGSMTRYFATGPRGRSGVCGTACRVHKLAHFTRSDHRDEPHDRKKHVMKTPGRSYTDARRVDFGRRGASPPGRVREPDTSGRGYTPIRHGLSEAPRPLPKVPVATFWCGIMAHPRVRLCWYANVISYRWNIGGRPPTVCRWIPSPSRSCLCASLGAVVSMLGLNGLPSPTTVFNAPASSAPAKTASSSASKHQTQVRHRQTDCFSNRSSPLDHGGAGIFQSFP